MPDLIPLPIYDSWRTIPEGITTKTRLEAMGLIPAPEQKPVALIAYKKECYQLWKIEEAIPKPPRTPRKPAQKKAAV